MYKPVTMQTLDVDLEERVFDLLTEEEHESIIKFIDDRVATFARVLQGDLDRRFGVGFLVETLNDFDETP